MASLGSSVAVDMIPTAVSATTSPAVPSGDAETTSLLVDDTLSSPDATTSASNNCHDDEEQTSAASPERHDDTLWEAIMSDHCYVASSHKDCDDRGRNSQYMTENVYRIRNLGSFNSVTATSVSFTKHGFQPYGSATFIGLSDDSEPGEDDEAEFGLYGISDVVTGYKVKPNSAGGGVSMASTALTEGVSNTGFSKDGAFTRLNVRSSTTEDKTRGAHPPVGGTQTSPSFVFQIAANGSVADSLSLRTATLHPVPGLPLKVAASSVNCTAVNTSSTEYAAQATNWLPQCNTARAGSAAAVSVVSRSGGVNSVGSVPFVQTPTSSKLGNVFAAVEYPLVESQETQTEDMRKGFSFAAQNMKVHSDTPSKLSVRNAQVQAYLSHPSSGSSATKAHTTLSNVDTSSAVQKQKNALNSQSGFLPTVDTSETYRRMGGAGFLQSSLYSAAAENAMSSPCTTDDSDHCSSPTRIVVESLFNDHDSAPGVRQETATARSKRSVPDDSVFVELPAMPAVGRTERPAKTTKRTYSDTSDYVTRCYCGLPHNDEFMIQCDRCEAWQHCECIGIKPKDVPECYLCELCSPRLMKMTEEKARKLQETKLAKMGVAKASDRRRRRRTVSNSITNKRSSKLPRMASSSLSTVAAADSESAMVAKPVSKVVGKSSQKHRRKSSLLDGGRKSVSFNELLAEAADTVEAQRMFTKLGLVPDCQALYVTPGRKGLVAVKTIPTNEPIIEFRGSASFAKDVKYLLPTGAMAPCLVLCSSPFDRSDAAERICIDATEGNCMARFVRRSCHPNAKIWPIVINHEFHALLVSEEDITKGTEITVPFEYDYGKCTTTVECACGLLLPTARRHECPISVFNRELISSSRKKSIEAAANFDVKKTGKKKVTKMLKKVEPTRKPKMKATPSFKVKLMTKSRPCKTRRSKGNCSECANDVDVNGTEVDAKNESTSTEEAESSVSGNTTNLTAAKASKNHPLQSKKSFSSFQIDGAAKKRCRRHSSAELGLLKRSLSSSMADAKPPTDAGTTSAVSPDQTKVSSREERKIQSIVSQIERMEDERRRAEERRKARAKRQAERSISSLSEDASSKTDREDEGASKTGTGFMNGPPSQSAPVAAGTVQRATGKVASDRRCLSLPEVNGLPENTIQPQSFSPVKEEELTNGHSLDGSPWRSMSLSSAEDVRETAAAFAFKTAKDRPQTLLTTEELHNTTYTDSPMSDPSSCATSILTNSDQSFSSPELNVAKKRWLRQAIMEDDCARVATNAECKADIGSSPPLPAAPIKKRKIMVGEASEDPLSQKDEHSSRSATSGCDESLTRVEAAELLTQMHELVEPQLGAVASLQQQQPPQLVSSAVAVTTGSTIVENASDSGDTPYAIAGRSLSLNSAIVPSAPAGLASFNGAVEHDVEPCASSFVDSIRRKKVKMSLDEYKRRKRSLPSDPVMLERTGSSKAPSNSSVVSKSDPAPRTATFPTTKPVFAQCSATGSPPLSVPLPPVVGQTAPPAQVCAATLSGSFQHQAKCAPNDQNTYAKTITARNVNDATISQRPNSASLQDLRERIYRTSFFSQQNERTNAAKTELSSGETPATPISDLEPVQGAAPLAHEMNFESGFESPEPAQRMSLMDRLRVEFGLEDNDEHQTSSSGGGASEQGNGQSFTPGCPPENLVSRPNYMSATCVPDGCLPITSPATVMPCSFSHVRPAYSIPGGGPLAPTALPRIPVPYLPSRCLMPVRTPLPPPPPPMASLLPSLPVGNTPVPVMQPPPPPSLSVMSTVLPSASSNGPVQPPPTTAEFQQIMSVVGAAMMGAAMMMGLNPAGAQSPVVDQSTGSSGRTDCDSDDSASSSGDSSRAGSRNRGKVGACFDKNRVRLNSKENHSLLHPTATSAKMSTKAYQRYAFEKS